MALRVGPIPQKCNVSNHGIVSRSKLSVMAKVQYINPNSLDNKGTCSCCILKDFYCSVTMLRELGLIIVHGLFSLILGLEVELNTCKARTELEFNCTTSNQ